VTASETYNARRELLLRQFRGSRGAVVGLSKDTSNLFRDRTGTPKRLLDVRRFDHVLALDEENGWVDAEGMTPYEELVSRTLEHRMMPAVVPELKTITVGGAAAGVGIEASSFKHGLVHETISEIEVVTGDGRVLTCRADNEHRDLFYAFPNSYGTLGYALRLRASTIPVKAFVEVRHVKYGRMDAFCDALARAWDEGADFIDGVAFDPGELYLNICRFVEQAPRVSDYTYEHIYYRSIREKAIDWLTVRDFIWRWDTDWFWCSRNMGAEIPFIRRLYGRKRLGSRTYQQIMRFNSRWGFTRVIDLLRRGHAESVIQDVDIPLQHASDFLAFFQKEVGITPVWLCPIGASSRAPAFVLYPLEPDARYVNFGFWDIVRREKPYPLHHFNGLIERKVTELGGIKSLYSESFFDEHEFWRIYGGESYRKLKAKYDPDHVFPDLYAKCVQRT
jgi:FAD/FMN-containing dehydrogenase